MPYDDIIEYVGA